MNIRTIFVKPDFLEMRFQSMEILCLGGCNQHNKHAIRDCPGWLSIFCLFQAMSADTERLFSPAKQVNAEDFKQRRLRCYNALDLETRTLLWLVHVR